MKRRIFSLIIAVIFFSIALLPAGLTQVSAGTGTSIHVHLDGFSGVTAVAIDYDGVWINLNRTSSKLYEKDDGKIYAKSHINGIRVISDAGTQTYTSYKDSTEASGSINYWIECAVTQYTVNYIAGANGSITGTATQTVNSGSSTTQVTAVPAAGYHFVSWSDGNLNAARNETNVTANATYTASFAINTYTVNYIADSNGTITGTAAQTVNYGQNTTNVTAAPNAGYHFVSWSDGNLSATRHEENVTANATYTASFAINTYTVTYSANANGSISGTAIQTVNSGADTTSVTAVPASGYHFVSWSDGNLNATRNETNVTANAAYAATFAANPIDQYTVTYIAGPNGSISGTASQTVNSGANTTEVTAVPAAGYHFVSWSDQNTNATRHEENVTANATYTATFAENEVDQYTINYIAGANGAVTGTASQTVISGGDTTEVTAVPAAGYHFVTWSDQNTNAARHETNVTANATYTATFAINTYTVTYSADAGGSISGTASQTVEYGADTTTVTAVPADGFHFVSWNDENTSATRHETNVTANAAYTATFAANPIDQFTVTYIAGPNGSISGTASQTVNSGANTTSVTAVPASGYHFVSWSDENTNPVRYETNVTANATYTATFARDAVNQYTITYTAGEGGSISGTTPQTVDAGSATTAVTAVPAAGYHFAYWNDENNNATRHEVNVMANASYTASFAKDQYTITFKAGDHGVLTGGDKTYNKNYGDSIPGAPTPDPDSGYRFTGWTPSLPGSSAKVTGNMTFTAKFARRSSGGTVVIPTPTPVVIEETPIPAGPAATPTPTPVVIQETPVPAAPATPAPVVLEETPVPGAPMLPKTGGIPAAVFYGSGAMAVLAGLLIRRKR